MHPSSESILSISKKYSIALACAAMALGLVGLSGWLFNSFSLRSFFSSGTTMKVNTALLIISTGLSLLLLNLAKPKLATLLLYAAGLFCLLILAEHIWQINLGIDEWWCKDKDYNLLHEPPGRTSIFLASSILGVCVTTLLVVYKKYHASQLLALALSLLVYAALLGYLFNAGELYRQENYSGIAIHTAASLLLLIVSIILYQARYGWVQLFVFQISGRKGLVYLLVYLLMAAPMVVGLYLYLLNHNQFSPAAGIIALTVVAVIIGLPIVFLVIKRISKADTSLRKTNQRLQIALDASQLGSYDMELATGEMECSQQCKANFGLPASSTFHFADLLQAIVPAHRSMVQERVESAIVTKTTYKAEYQVQWPDGSLHWISAAGNPLYDIEGKAISIIGVTQDITVQKETDARKNAFIGIVSHELKTPLTSIKAYVQMLHVRAQAEGNTPQVNALAKTEVQVNKMTTIINGFLDVARLESGTMHFSPSQFSINKLIEEVLQEYRFIHASSSISLAACPDINVTADREKIEHVVANLVGNAIKYSLVGKPVEVGCHPIPGATEVYVKDAGMGISANEIPRLFDRFYRAEPHTTNGHISGFGIGLYLSAEIVKMHGGSIRVESEPGKGSTFYFTLPVLAQ